MPFFILLLMVLVSTPCSSQTLNESPDQVWEVGDRRWTVEEERDDPRTVPKRQELHCLHREDLSKKGPQICRLLDPAAAANHVET